MRRIITAIGNPILNQRLKQEKNFEIVLDDIQYKEGILEFLEKDNNIDVLILSELLPGNIEIKEIIEKIKVENPNIEIILFLENTNKELENYLFAKGIYNIFYNNQVEIQEIVQLIENKKKDPNIELKKELNELKKIILEKEQKTNNNFNKINGEKVDKNNIIKTSLKEKMNMNKTKNKMKIANKLKTQTKVEKANIICISRN